MKIAGLDVGTTGCKCTVFDEQGNYIDKAYRSYPVKRKTEEHVIDATVIMDGVYACIREMAKQYPDILGIGVTSFGETFVCTDEKGIPLYPAMLYTDPRGAEQCSALTKKIPQKEITAITGLRPHEMYSVSKIMWLKENKPEIYKKAKHIFLMEDYVIWHLTGEAKIDYSLAARTMAFDIKRLVWSEKIFEAAGIRSELMSEPVQTGSIVGSINKKTADKTGLCEEVRIISGGHDQLAAAVGAGVFDASAAVDGAGTVECLTPVYEEMPDMEVMYEGYFSVIPYVVPGTYVAYAFSYTGGALLQWCTDTLAKKEKETAGQQGISVNAYMEKLYAESMGDTPVPDLLVLPHFAGAATPYMDTASKGAVLGLTTGTTLEQIYRACMEAVVYEMYLNMQALSGSGVKFKSLRATGGGANSSVWMQMKADVLNMPVTALKTVDAGTTGCAMLTGVAVGLFRNLEAAAEYMVKEMVTYMPRKDMHEAYMKNYERYSRLYAAVRPLV